MTEHPITPPPDLREQWLQSPHDALVQAARWGADQQLEQDAKWLDETALFSHSLTISPSGDALRQAMRPKPPSLKEQALIELGDVYNRDKIDDVTYDTIRLALEALPE